MQASRARMGANSTAALERAALRLELAALRNETSLALDDLRHATDTVFYLLAAIVIFFMQAGFAMLEAGTVREQSVREILLKNLLDASVGALAWFLVGAMLAADTGGPFIGWPRLAGNATYTPFEAVELVHGTEAAKYLMGFMYAVTSATIVSGAIAERTQQRAYIISSSLMTALVYPVVVHWVWSTTGWLSRANPEAVLGGAYDFAGGGVVHLVGGTMALLAAKIVGPRAGRFGVPGGGGRVVPVEMRGHSSVLVVLGTFLLWIGWLGFNVGSTKNVTAPGAALLAAQVAVRTTLAGSAGCLVSIGAARCVSKQVWSLEFACNGVLAGLVSVTASAPAVGDIEALVIGAIGGLVYAGTSHIVRARLCVDDVLDAFAVHGACGLWSLLASGLFAKGASVGGGGGGGVFAGGDGSLLAASLVEALSIVAWVSAFGLLVYAPLHHRGLLRIPQRAEITGMDISDTGRPAYDGPAWSPLGRAPTSAVGLPVVPAEEEVDTARGRVPAPWGAAARLRAQGEQAQGALAFDAARGRATVEAVPVQVGERLGVERPSRTAVGVEIELAPLAAPAGGRARSVGADGPEGPEGPEGARGAPERR